MHECLQLFTKPSIIAKVVRGKNQESKYLGVTHTSK